MDKLRSVTITLAERIAECRVYNLAEISNIIYVGVKSSLREILKEQLTIEEREYVKVLELQATLKIGSPEYVKNGYKLATAKQKKSQVNRALYEITKDCKFTALKTFIKENHGVDVLADILSQEDK